MYYDRKIKYLDYYERGERVRGGGHAKLEVRDGKLRLELAVTGMHVTDSFVRDVLLLSKEREKIVGKIEISEGRGSCRMQWDQPEDIGGTGISYGQLCGIRIPLGTGREIVCRWQVQGGGAGMRGNSGQAQGGDAGMRENSRQMQVRDAGMRGNSGQAQARDAGMWGNSGQAQARDAGMRENFGQVQGRDVRMWENSGEAEMKAAEASDRSTQGSRGTKDDAQVLLMPTPKKRSFLSDVFVPRSVMAGSGKNTVIDEKKTADYGAVECGQEAVVYGTVDPEKETVGYRAVNQEKETMGYRVTEHEKKSMNYRGVDPEKETVGYRAANQEKETMGYRVTGHEKKSMDYREVDQEKETVDYRTVNHKKKSMDYRGLDHEKPTMDYMAVNYEQKAVGYRAVDPEKETMDYRVVDPGKNIGSTLTQERIQEGNSERSGAAGNVVYSSANRGGATEAGGKKRHSAGMEKGESKTMLEERGNSQRERQGIPGGSKGYNQNRRDEALQAPVKLLENKWSQLWAIYPHIRPFNDKREYISIGPSDFVLFPEESYRMANNSFLLHGFYNYHHLLLAKVERKGEVLYYIGVPGTFFEKEKQVAIMFGFESFECAEEPAQAGDFGYYMMRTGL